MGAGVVCPTVISHALMLRGGLMPRTLSVGLLFDAMRTPWGYRCISIFTACLYPRLIDSSRLDFCAESVTTKRQSPAPAAHTPFKNNLSGVRGIFAHSFILFEPCR